MWWLLLCPDQSQRISNFQILKGEMWPRHIIIYLAINVAKKGGIRKQTIIKSKYEYGKEFDPLIIVQDAIIGNIMESSNQMSWTCIHTHTHTRPNKVGKF